MDNETFSKDTLDFLSLLSKHKVRYVIVGGEAVIFYGHIRLTGDTDFFYDASESNTIKLYAALIEFWEGSIPGISTHIEFTVPGTIIQFGKPPNRIDLINTIEGVTFDEAWESKVRETIKIEDEQVSIYYIGIDKLIQNKEALKRNKDQDDLKFLQALLEE